MSLILKLKGDVKIKWSSNFAYAIGLIVTDGCLGRDGGHIDFTSKDLEQIENFKKCLGITAKIGYKISGGGFVSRRIQFRNEKFYAFLVKIGLTPSKSKTIGKIMIPDRFFFDFLRGSFDGDGTFYSYWDKRWKSSFMFYTEFISASQTHIDWIRSKIYEDLGINGHITTNSNNVCKQLKYAKADSLKIIRKMYYSNNVVCLSRKKLKINKVLAMIGEKVV
jgi:hypothetical protein